MIHRTLVTHIMEDYLKAIYHLENLQEAATTKEIAREMSVSPSSVTSMLRKLAALGTISYTPYGRIGLTDKGKRIALEVIRHHRLLELFLREKLGYSLERVHEEAERLEHVISEEFEDKIAAALEDPRVDPHGEPIPARDGSMMESPLVSLSGIETGRRITIRQLASRRPDELRYLEEIGLLPGVCVRVLSKKPVDGPMSLRIDRNRVETIGHELAQRILVQEEYEEEMK